MYNNTLDKSERENDILAYNMMDPDTPFADCDYTPVSLDTGDGKKVFDYLYDVMNPAGGAVAGNAALEEDFRRNKNFFRQRSTRLRRKEGVYKQKSNARRPREAASNELKIFTTV